MIKMKKIISFALAVVLLIALTACSRNSTDIEVYTKYAQEDKYLPVLEELGEYASVQSLYHHDSALIFFWDAYNLIVGYDELQYEQAKAAVEERYTFTEDIIHSSIEGPHDEWELVDYPPSCDLYGYHMRILDTNGYTFPKDVYLVGTNDDSHRIAYVRFYDIDLDSVESLESFLLDECGWSELKKRDML